MPRCSSTSAPARGKGVRIRSATTRCACTDRPAITQQAVARDVGDEILKATATDTDVLVSVTRDNQSRTLYVKLVNPGDTAAPVQLNVAGATLPATALTIVGSAQDTNSIDAPERVVPKTSQVTAVTSGFTYTLRQTASSC